MKILVTSGGPRLRYWKFRLLKELAGNSEINVYLLTVTSSRSETDVNPKQFELFSTPPDLYHLVHNLLTPPDLRLVERAEISGVVSAETEISLAEFREGPPAEIMGGFEPAEFEVLLQLIPGNIRGDWQRCLSHGIWKIPELLSETKLPPLFWSWYHNKKFGQVTLVENNQAGENECVLRQSKFALDGSSFTNSLNKALHEAIYLPQQAAADRLAGISGEQSATREKATVNVPNLFIRILFYLVWFIRNIKELSSNLWYSVEWNIGVVDCSRTELLKSDPPDKISWFKKSERSRLRVQADPFSFESAGQRYVLFEQERYNSPRGRLVGLEFPGGDPIELRGDLSQTGQHRSYPFVFEFNGEIYCLPEQADSNHLALYRCTDVPGSWAEEQVIIENIEARDPTLVQYEGKWWVFFTDAVRGPNHKLHIWFADQLTGEWRPHPANPVKNDVRSARPAGDFFSSNNRLYRPAQDCSAGYGGAIQIMEVKKLTSEKFVEARVCQLSPPEAWRYSSGMHTINSCGNQVLVDGKRFVGFFSRVRRLLGRQLIG